MEILEDLAFRIEPSSADKSCIFLDGKPTNKSVEGAYLELCLKLGQQYLVFMTDDIPGEDMLHIHLLAEDLSVIDSATIGGMYSTGSFTNYTVLEPNQITFNFIGGNEWRVEVLEDKVFSLPFVSSPKGVARKHPFYQYFKLYGDPQPEQGK
jgi:hypothetical protein